MRISFVILMAVFLYAIGFLANWQLFNGEELYATVFEQSLRTTSLSPQRGTIYDANGKVLAQSASVWSVVLEPVSISGNDERTEEETKALIARELAEILDMDEEYILGLTNQNSYFTYVKRKIEDEVKNEILAFMEEYNIGSGVRFLSEYKRYYPYGTLASPLIGFVGTDNNGLNGLEYQYENELSGTTGTMLSMKNALGGDMPFQYEQYISSENGYDLVLTLDETVQSIAEKYLIEGIEKYGVEKGGTAIVMDVETGGIIAMASADNFDLNDPFTVYDQVVLAEIDALPEDEQSQAYSDALYTQWRNKAVSDTYYPGSVFKTVTGAAALDSGTITEHTTYNCAGSYVAYPGTSPIHCWIHGSHGDLNVTGGLTNSCNPFFMQAAEDMGAELFFSYFEAFGFTEKTGIDLPGEATGVYFDQEDLGPIELATVSFGQNFGVTPMQMLTAIAAVANGGYLVTPHLVDRMLDSDGNVVESTEETEKRQVISSEVAGIIADAMAENVESGTATTGAVAGYDIAAKTGTSEKMEQYLSAGGEEPMQYISSFAGFAPADDPKYAVLVYYDEPDREIASGARQAGPVFANIMSEILPYLGVEKNVEDTMYADMQTETPNVVGLTVKEAQDFLDTKGLEWEVYNGDFLSGDTGYDENAVIKMQIPPSDYTMPIDGKVIISTESSINSVHMVAVPDFEGKSISECYQLASSAGLQVLIYGDDGTGDLRAITQTQTPEMLVKPGTVVSVNVADISGIEVVD